MNVFIMRHGEAEAHSATDMQRQLTPQGRADIAQMMDSHRNDLVNVEVIWASPYMRAQQTAQIAAESLGVPVVHQNFLPPNGNPDDVINALQEHREQVVLMVTHQPLVSILVDGLAGLETGRYRMGPGALACLSTTVYANSCCQLQWLHQPTSIQPVS